MIRWIYKKVLIQSWLLISSRKSFANFFGFIVMRHVSRIVKDSKCLFISPEIFVIVHCYLTGRHAILFALDKMNRNINAIDDMKQVEGKSVDLGGRRII